jgi:hypothetical protein
MDLNQDVELGEAGQTLLQKMRPRIRPDISVGSIITILLAVVPLLLNMWANQGKVEQQLATEITIRSHENANRKADIVELRRDEVHDFAFFQTEFNNSQQQITASIARLNASITDLRDQMITHWNMQEYGGGYIPATPERFRNRRSEINLKPPGAP